MSPDLNPIENLWRNLKIAVWGRYLQIWGTWSSLQKNIGLKSQKSIVRNLLMFTRSGCSVILSKGCATKYCTWSVNTFVQLTFGVLCQMINVFIFLNYYYLLCFLVASKLNEDIHTKAFVIAIIFFQKLSNIWQICRGANNFCQHCRYSASQSLLLVEWIVL